VLPKALTFSYGGTNIGVRTREPAAAVRGAKVLVHHFADGRCSRRRPHPLATRPLYFRKDAHGPAVSAQEVPAENPFCGAVIVWRASAATV
jgi:hypothetical protein